jgi:hypothetical protein
MSGWSGTYTVGSAGGSGVVIFRYLTSDASQAGATTVTVA